MRRAIQVRTERHAVFIQLAELTQTEDLEATRIRQDRAIPSHEAVQPAHPPHVLDSWPQIEVIGVPEQNLDSEFFEQILRDALHRSESSHGHEHRRLDDPVWRDEPA